MNNAFVMYADILPQLSFLSREQMGDLFRAILQYVAGEEVDRLDDVTQMAFGFIAAQIDRDREKYNEKCEKAKAAIKKRWAAEEHTDEYERIRTYTDEYGRIKRNTENTDVQNVIHTDTDTDTVPDTDTVCVKGVQGGKAQRFLPPTHTDVQNYCDSKGYKIDVDRFIDFYTSKGWTVGKSPMKDWRAAVRNWAKNDRASPKKNAFTGYEDQRDNREKIAALEKIRAPVEDYGALEAALLGRA